MKKKYSASSKDKKDWKAFIKQNQDIGAKDVDLPKENRKTHLFRKLDLHGYSLDDANKKVKEFVIESFNKGFGKLLIVTGKGSRSKVNENPYISEKFSVLKYSIPEFIKNNAELDTKVTKISQADKNHGGEGAIYLFLRNNKKL